MKYAAILLSLVVLSGCERSTSERTDDFILPEGLKHCKIYKLSNGISHMKVVHCPNSTTSTTHSCGKNCTAHNTVISE